MNIIEETKQELNQLIMESLTVNDDVMQNVKEIEDYINKNIATSEIIKTYNGGSQRLLSFSHTLFNDLDCSINVECNNFKNEKYFKEYNKNNTINTECVSVFRQIRGRMLAIITIRYISINFKPLEKFYQDVPHEVNHIFQQYMDKQTYPDSEKYIKYASDFNFSNDNKINKVSRLLYLLNKGEEDSTITSVYNFVKHKVENGDYNIDKLFQETEAFQNIMSAKQLYDEIKTNKEDFNEIVTKRYNFKDCGVFLRRIKDAIKRYEKKFSMVCVKCKRDFVIFETHTSFRGNVLKYILFS